MEVPLGKKLRKTRKMFCIFNRVQKTSKTFIYLNVLG